MSERYVFSMADPDPDAKEDARGDRDADGAKTGRDAKEDARGDRDADGAKMAREGDEAKTGRDADAATPGPVPSGSDEGGATTGGSAGGPRSVDGSLPFPPDEVLDLPDRTSFVSLLVLVALIAFLVDLVSVHFLAVGPRPSGAIPYNYQFFAGVVYLVAAIPLVRRVHDVLAAVRSDLVELADRGTLVGGRLEGDPSPGEIDAEMTRTLQRAFHPRVLLGGAAVAGALSLGAVVWANTTAGAGEPWVYPHLLTAFAYGAVHGLFAGPLLGGLVLVRRVANEYIVDVDVLAPDGMGGYRAVGDALVTLLTFALLLVTIDFVVLSSALYVSSAQFRWVVVALYGGGLVGLVGLTTVGVVGVRNRLLAVRDRKVEDLREEFEAVEAAFWEKHRRGEDCTVEAEKIRTMRAMFVELNGMALWPLNLHSVLKALVGVGASVGTSVLVVAIKQQWLVGVLS